MNKCKVQFPRNFKIQINFISDILSKAIFWKLNSWPGSFEAELLKFPIM